MKLVTLDKHDSDYVLAWVDEARALSREQFHQRAATDDEDEKDAARALESYADGVADALAYLFGPLPMSGAEPGLQIIFERFKRQERVERYAGEEPRISAVFSELEASRRRQNDA